MFHSESPVSGMNLLSTLNKKNYTLRRSARLLATQAPPDGSQSSKRKCATNNDTSVAINRPPLELQSEPEIDDLLALKKRKTLGKEPVDPDHENTTPSKRKGGPYLEPVYIIPDVEKKKTTFRGRLGWHL